MRIFNPLRKYLDAYGGVRSLPRLWRKIIGIYRAGGWSALYGRINGFREKAEDIALPSLEDILEKPRWREWQESLRSAFAGTDSLLVIDHMYGGGANAYREQRISASLDRHQPVLLLTWDLFNKIVICTAYLGDSTLVFFTTGLAGILRQNALRFDKILVNSLYLWSSNTRGANPYGETPRILSLISEIRLKNNAAMEFALHDYYPICPSYTLTTRGHHFCGLPRDIHTCQKCLRQNSLQFKLPRRFSLEEWRQAWQIFFNDTTEIRAFAKAPLQLYTKILDIRPDICAIKPHTLLAQWTETYKAPAAKKLRIGVIGEIAPHKGADIVRKIGYLLQEDELMIVIGSLDGPTPPRTQVHGKYTRGELPRLLNKYGITVALVPSIWPETFCYTAQECESLGVPLVVFPIGAQGERIGHYLKGLAAEDITPEAALDALRKLNADRAA